MEFEFNSHRDNNHVAAVAIAVFLQFKVLHLKKYQQMARKSMRIRMRIRMRIMILNLMMMKHRLRVYCLSYYYNEEGLRVKKKFNGTLMHTICMFLCCQQFAV